MLETLKILTSWVLALCGCSIQEKFKVTKMIKNMRLQYRWSLWIYILFSLPTPCEPRAFTVTEARSMPCSVTENSTASPSAPEITELERCMLKKEALLNSPKL